MDFCLCSSPFLSSFVGQHEREKDGRETNFCWLGSLQGCVGGYGQWWTGSGMLSIEDGWFFFFLQGCCFGSFWPKSSRKACKGKVRERKEEEEREKERFLFEFFIFFIYLDRQIKEREK